MRLPKLKKARITKRTVLDNKRPENTLLAIVQYDLDNGDVIHEIAPISYKHKAGQAVGYYAVQFIDQRYLYNIIRL